MTHRSNLQPLAALMLACAMLASCGGGDAEAPPPPVANTPAPPPPAAPDTVPPTVTIASDVSATTATGPVTFTFVFSEDVGVSFDATDIVVTGGTPSAFTRVPGGTQATLVVTPPANATGTITVSVAAGKFTDIAGNANTVGATASKNFNTVVAAGGGGGGGGGTSAAIVTFDEATPPTLTDFGGVTSSIVIDPSGGTNKVLKLVKPVAANLWGGTTVSNGANQSIPTIAFSATATKMTVRAYSPAVGIHVRLKVEDAANNTHTVETEALTTVANAWETLTFDFSAPATGTAALNLAFTYNKVSIFADFGLGSDGGANQMPGQRTYYFDDITFLGGATAGGGGGGGTAGTVTFSSGFAASNLTVEGGAFGGYSGSSVDNFNCGAPASCGSGGTFTPTATAATSGFYYYYQTPSPVTSLYAGIFIQAPSLTTGLSGTGDTPGVSISGKTTMKFTFNQNPEWFNGPANNFGVILTLGKYYNVSSNSTPQPCNIKLLAVVTPTALAPTAYTIPISSFGLIQTCNVSGLTPASALALSPLSQVDFQAVGSGNPLPPVGGKLVGANMSVGTGSPAVYPTTLALTGGITFQ